MTARNPLYSPEESAQYNCGAGPWGCPLGPAASQAAPCATNIMLLALDVGNSNITIGAFDQRRLVSQWRLRTVHGQTADEWGVLLRNLFALASLDSPGVDGIIIASVVPSLDSNLAAMAQRYFQVEPTFVTPQTDIGMPIRYDDPNQVGADRLANAVAALHRYGGPCVVVDLGTTVNFDCISAKGEYLGGAIAIGIGISIEALFSKTASGSLSKRSSARPRACRWWTFASRPKSSAATQW